MGGAIGFIVREGEAELGRLRSGNDFVIAAQPRKHACTVHSEAADNTTLEVEEGETYFVAAFEETLPKLEPSKPLK